MKRLTCIVFLCICLKTKAQKNHFNLVFAYGPSYFLNDASLPRRIDHIEAIGLNYAIHTKGQNIIFNPGIHFQVNRYAAKLSYNGLVHVNQATIGLNLDVLMRIRKRMFLRVGLLFSGVPHTNIEVSHTNYNSRGYYSNDNIYVNYSPRFFQSAANIGMCFVFKLFRREQKFNIKIFQYATGLVNSDYWLSKVQVGEDIKVLSTKARPTMLIFALEINLQKFKKPKKETEE